MEPERKRDMKRQLLDVTDPDKLTPEYLLQLQIQTTADVTDLAMLRAILQRFQAVAGGRSEAVIAEHQEFGGHLLFVVDDLQDLVPTLVDRLVDRMEDIIDCDCERCRDAVEKMGKAAMFDRLRENAGSN